MRFATSRLNNFMGGTSDFSNIAGTSIKGRGLERRAAMEGEAAVAQAGMKGLGQVKSARFQEDVIAARSSANSGMYAAQGAEAGVQGILGGLMNMPSGGSSPSFGGGSFGRLPENPMDSFRNAGVTGPIYDFSV